MFEKFEAQVDALDSTLIELAQSDPRIVALTADMADRIIPRFAREMKHRFFNYGIAEQGMMGTAAGLALSGFIPLVTTLCCFISMKTTEQIRDDIAYPNMNVKIVGMGGGLMYGTLGPTHQGLEDISLMKSISNLVVMAPADSVETRYAVRAAFEHYGPVYMRLGRGSLPVVHSDVSIKSFRIGKAIRMREGKDISIIATGVMVAKALVAAKSLESKGISVSVYSMHTVKPLDVDAILEAAEATYGVITLEDNNVRGGMGEAICGVLSQARPTRVKILGIPDVFPIIGSPEDLYREYGLSEEHIEKAALEMVGAGQRA